MSEAMSSVEIEDVLSSIRRLVSGDHRPAPQAAPVKKPDDKLILTPAFRVVAEAPAAPVRAAPLPRLHLGVAPMIEKAATLERAVEAQDIEWESEVGDPAPIIAEMEWTESGWATPESPVALASPLAASQSWAQDEPDQADDYGMDDSMAAAGLSGNPLYQDTPIAEPDAQWADQAEAEAVAALRDDADPTTDAFDIAGAELTFDEQVLRDLVRDLIREELQGGLGERITRNVRKLVRAEIARALAAQEFDLP